MSSPALVRLLALAAFAASCDRAGPGSKVGETGKKRAAITALGRVTPGRAAISIAAQSGNRLLKLEVSEGKKVRAGDVLAYLESYTLRLAERDAAKVALEETRDRLEKETTYAEAVIEQARHARHLLETALDHERKELKRMESLGNLTTAQRFDDQRFLVQSREGELAKANAELMAAEAALARIRSIVAVKSAEAQLTTAEAQLELTIIRAPIDGEILKVYTYPGERIGNEPILKMGDTTDMHVIVEVHETDVRAVRVGQRATITSEALAEPVHGVVEEVGELIYKNDVLNLDPRADQDTRVVEVRVKLEKSEEVAHLTHLEVSTRIELDSSPAGATSAAR